MDSEAERATRERIAVVRASMTKVDQLLDELANAMAAKGVVGATASPPLLAELETVGTQLLDLGDHLAHRPE